MPLDSSDIAGKIGKVVNKTINLDWWSFSGLHVIRSMIIADQFFSFTSHLRPVFFGVQLIMDSSCGMSCGQNLFFFITSLFDTNLNPIFYNIPSIIH